MKQAIILFVLTLLTASSVLADSGQYGQYGGGAPSGSIMIDKTVSYGTTTKGGIMSYVDNYSASDARLHPSDQVYFQIKVKNTSNVTLTNVQVQDVLPSYVDAVEGPGSYNTNNKTISWTYSELKAGEEKVEKVIAKVYVQGRLPADRGLMCMVNKADVRVGDVTDSDTAQFCIEKQVITKGGVPPQKVPQAGPEFGFLVTALSMSTLGAGIYLKKKI
jgi:uncharacterized repeat protein (TIGR01451 family)